MEILEADKCSCHLCVSMLAGAYCLDIGGLNSGFVVLEMFLIWRVWILIVCFRYDLGSGYGCKSWNCE